MDDNGNPIAAPCTTLAPFDLTRGGTLFPSHRHADIKLLSLYVQDAITKGNWSFNVGVRGDIYNGLTSHKEAQPRLGVAYNIKKTNTVLRASYARMLETPFNENLVLSSTGCANPVLNPLLTCSSLAATPFSPGWRNIHAGLRQAFGRYLVFSVSTSGNTLKCVRFRNIRCYYAHLPDRVAQLQDSGRCGTRKCSEHPWILGSVRVLQRDLAVFQPPVGWSRRGSARNWRY